MYDKNYTKLHLGDKVNFSDGYGNKCSQIMSFNFIEKYNDISLFSKSIIGKCDKPLLNRTFSKDEINKIALSENTLKK